MAEKKTGTSKKVKSQKVVGKKVSSKIVKKGASKKKARPSELVATATLRHARIPAQKMRLVLNIIKGKQLDIALSSVQFMPNKGAKMLYKLLRSAMANAEEKGGVDVDQLWVTGGKVDMGKTLRRFLPRAQGRATPIRKRSSHITVELGRYV